jgi:hypothetical protein
LQIHFYLISPTDSPSSHLYPCIHAPASQSAHINFPAHQARQQQVRVLRRETIHEFSRINEYLTASFLDGIVAPKPLNRFHILPRKDAPILQFAPPKVEQQPNGRADGFQIVDNLC